MPKLFNVDNCLFQTVALTSLDSDESQEATFTGITTDDYVGILYNNDSILTTESGFNIAVAGADTVVLTPAGCSGAGTAVAQTVGLIALVNPTSGQEGGSW